MARVRFGRRGCTARPHKDVQAADDVGMRAGALQNAHFPQGAQGPANAMVDASHPLHNHGCSILVARQSFRRDAEALSGGHEILRPVDDRVGARRKLLQVVEVRPLSPAPRHGIRRLLSPGGRRRCTAEQTFELGRRVGHRLGRFHLRELRHHIQQDVPRGAQLRGGGKPEHPTRGVSIPFQHFAKLLKSRRRRQCSCALAWLAQVRPSSLAAEAPCHAAIKAVVHPAALHWPDRTNSALPTGSIRAGRCARRKPVRKPADARAACASRAVPASR
eukprot:scaffold1355_cov268-Pinguiococcus_pyrenoidosus.AAC.24